MKAIPIGISDYRKLRKNDYYFVDKSLMIRDFLDKKSQVTVITRPRRFGKTLNMSMMAEFFDITKDSKDIFKDTKIMETPYASEINQYPTIYITFANVKGDKYSIISMIKDQLLNEWEKHSFVFSNLNDFDKPRYQQLMQSLTDFDNDDLKGINNALSFLMKRMESYYGRRVMVFIDEYDTPFIETQVGGFYQEIRVGLSALLHNSLKTSKFLKYALLTGIQRVAKENIFSDLNNLDVYSVVDDEYNDYFGFNSQETQQLLEYFGLKLDDEVKKMYDGYKIGGVDIYNPWSILNYAQRKELVPYWVNTSANTMIREAITSSTDDFRNDYEKLVINGQLETSVSLQTSFYEQSTSATLWGLLVNAGYLTVKEIIDRYNDRYCLMIPNMEVRKEFINLTEYQLGLNSGKLYSVVNSLVDEKFDEFLKQYQSVLMLPSYYDLTSENSYHMMMLGMCLCYWQQYEIISNRETGKGRSDIILKSKDEKKSSFIIEFKYIKDDKKDTKHQLSVLAEKALKQIKDKKYDHDLNGKIIYIALAHHGKEVAMKWEYDEKI